MEADDPLAGLPVVVYLKPTMKAGYGIISSATFEGRNKKYTADVYDSTLTS